VCGSDFVNLAEVEDGDKYDAPANVSYGCEQKPIGVVTDGDLPSHDGGEDLAAASDAVGEMSESDDECQHPDDGNLTDRPVTCGDDPCHESDEPSADNAAPEDGRAVTLHCTQAEGSEFIRDLRFQRQGSSGKECEERSAGNVTEENDGPEAQRIKDVLPFAEYESDGIQSVLGEELLATDDDGNEAERIEHQRDEFLRASVAENGLCRRDTKTGEPHSEPSSDAGEHERASGTAKLFVATVFDEVEYLVDTTAH
jgi:hypothetical protein